MKLTPSENKLARLLADQKIVSKTDMLIGLYGTNNESKWGSVRVLIKRLRDKVEPKGIFIHNTPMRGWWVGVDNRWRLRRICDGE